MSRMRSCSAFYSPNVGSRQRSGNMYVEGFLVCGAHLISVLSFRAWAVEGFGSQVFKFRFKAV